MQQKPVILAAFLPLLFPISDAAAIEPVASWNGDTDDQKWQSVAESVVVSPEGLDGKGFEFDGESTYVSTDLPVSPRDMPETTWMAWVYPRRLDGRRLVLEADDAGFDRFVAIENGRFGVGTGRGIWFPAEAKANVWQHVAVVFTPESIHFYLNGEEFLCPDQPEGQESATKFRFGGSALWRQFFDGLLDEVRVYDTPLPHDQIRCEFERLREAAEKTIGQSAVGDDKNTEADRKILPSPAESSDALRMVYTPSHRATFEQEWKYSFPNHHSTRWFIALRYPPALEWSQDVEAKAELLTSKGWIPFKQVYEGSPDRRRMLVIDHLHNDRVLSGGFTIRTSITATVYDQAMTVGVPPKAVAPLTEQERKLATTATATFDFKTRAVKDWMNRHSMWVAQGETTLDFVKRVYSKIREELPYDTKDGGPWICSQILTVGYGECARHAIVGTSILRANNIPARTICALWAVDEASKGAHCWGEFFLDGVGWVPYDTTGSEFAKKKGNLIAGMVDFDWMIDAGTLGKHTVFAIDAWPAFWSKGRGNLNDPTVETKTQVRVLPSN